MYLRTLLLLTCSIVSDFAQEDSLHREDFFIESEDGIQLALRSIEEKNSKYSNIIVMIHGGGPGAIASFDLPVAGGSFAGDLAERGNKIYLVNIRGWGGSTDPVVDDSSFDTNVTYLDAAKDLDAAVNTILDREKTDKFALFGWATGGHWGGFYVTQHPEKISHFISLNSLYGIEGKWDLRPYFWNEKDTTQYNKQAGPWRRSPKEALTRMWTRTIPTEDKQSWRDPMVADAYSTIAVESEYGDYEVMTVPSGYREESFYMSLGKKYWDARDIRVPSLIIRGENDFWSRPLDLTAIKNDLVNSPNAQFLVIPEATHYVFLDRNERGRKTLLDAIDQFIN